MSYTSEHRRLAPVLAQARALNIDWNPAPAALFDPGNAGFNIWCTPEDQPEGWDGLQMDAGAWSKPCAFVASVGWGWAGEEDENPIIAYLTLETAAYALRDQQPNAYHDRVANIWPINRDQRRPIFNRPEDLAWAEAKIRWLFTRAGVPCPEIRVTPVPGTPGS